MTAHIQTPTPNLKASLDFYKTLNFKVLKEGDSSFVTDGKALIEINTDRFARAGVKMFSTSWKEKVESLKKQFNVNTIDGGYLLAAPSGVRVYLMEGNSPIDFTPEEASFGVPGNYMGLSVETTDFAGSFAFWESFGFSAVMGGVDKGYVVMLNSEGFGFSFMKPNSCPHLFFNPSLTYFNSGKNPAVIAKLRELNIPITEEITHFNKEGIVDNVIIRDPGGLGFFVFND